MSSFNNFLFFLNSIFSRRVDLAWASSMGNSRVTKWLKWTKLKARGKKVQPRVDNPHIKNWRGIRDKWSMEQDDRQMYNKLGSNWRWIICRVFITCNSVKWLMTQINRMVSKDKKNVGKWWREKGERLAKDLYSQKTT